jgi:hypothetical protein
MSATTESFAYLNARAKAAALRAECYRWEAAAARVIGDALTFEHYSSVAEQCERRAATWERWAGEAPDAPVQGGRTVSVPVVDMAPSAKAVSHD